MKKIFYLVIALLCIESGLYAYNPQYNTRKNRKKNQHLDNYCINCCKDGRFASDECKNKRRCNNCQQYNDSAAAEGRDYP